MRENLGVSHLGGKLVRRLRKDQEELGITNKDVLCVEIAGLCHDLGHGPISHLFDGRFIPRARAADAASADYDNDAPEWSHEEGSIRLLTHMIRNTPELRQAFRDRGLTDRDVLFIKELIAGPALAQVAGQGEELLLDNLPMSCTNSNNSRKGNVNNSNTGRHWEDGDYCPDYSNNKIRKPVSLPQSPPDSNNLPASGRSQRHHQGLMDAEQEDLPCTAAATAAGYDGDGMAYLYRGRGRNKAFLYEIISNESNGIDVDKYDYLCRDAAMIDFGNPKNHIDRLMAYVRVIEVNGRTRICFPEKQATDIRELFHLRRQLHIRCYKHKTVKIVEHMICEAMLIANDHLEYPRGVYTGGDEKKKVTGAEYMRISDTIKDMATFGTLNDSVLDLIRLSKKSELKEARELLERVQRRELFRFVGEMSIGDRKRQADKIQSELWEIAMLSDCTKASQFCKDDILVELVKFDNGKGNNHALDGIYFFDKYGHESEEGYSAKMYNLGMISYAHDMGVHLERYVRVYSVKNDFFELLSMCFRQWSAKACLEVAEEMNYPTSDIYVPTPCAPKKKHGYTRSALERDVEGDRHSSVRNVAMKLDFE
eukprot:Nk52_evm39s153 gene=Nk52_evmTU39s153